jgi:hypothetical protein
MKALFSLTSDRPKPIANHITTHDKPLNQLSL